MIRHFGDKDPTTRTIIEEILADEEEHASDLADLLFVVDPHTGKDRGQDPGTDPLRLGQRPMGSQQPGQEETQMAGNDESRQQRGMTNRQAAEELQRGGLKQVESGNRSLSGRSRSEDATTQGDIHGHPKRKGIPEPEDFDGAGDVHPGEETGRNRSAHVTNPNKKRKRVA
jgi:hypothetical protein